MPQPTPVGPVISIAITPGLQGRPHVVGLGDGRYAVAWQDGASEDVRVETLANVILFGDSTIQTSLDPIAGFPREMQAAALADGRFIVAWHDTTTNGGEPRAQFFNP